MTVTTTTLAMLEPGQTPTPDDMHQARKDILQGGFVILVVVAIGIFALVKLLRSGKKK